MSDSNHHSDDHAHGDNKTYTAVFIALVILTAISFGIGSSPLPAGVMRFAMIAVSCVKAMLVILFFMHLLWEANWKYVLTVPSMMMSLFLLCMLIPDVGLRMNRYSVERIWRSANVKAKEDVHDEKHAEDGEGHEGHNEHP